VATLGGKVIVGGRVVVVAGYVVCGRVVATTTPTAGKWAWNGVWKALVKGHYLYPLSDHVEKFCLNVYIW
jgi:hypothetical protein